MRIDGLSEPLKSEIIKKAESEKKVQSAPKSVTTNDRAAFSSESKRLSQTQSELQISKNQVQALAEVRTELVEETRAKIQQGYYNTEEFVDKLAEKLTKDFGIQ